MLSAWANKQRYCFCMSYAFYHYFFFFFFFFLLSHFVVIGNFDFEYFPSFYLYSCICPYVALARDVRLYTVSIILILHR